MIKVPTKLTQKPENSVLEKLIITLISLAHKRTAKQNFGLDFQESQYDF